MSGYNCGPDKSNKDLGLKIAKRRNLLEWSQEELSEKAGLTRNTVQRIENGAEPKAETLLQLCDALTVSPNELLGYKDDPFAGIGPELAEAVKHMLITAQSQSPSTQKAIANLIESAESTLRLLKT